MAETSEQVFATVEEKENPLPPTELEEPQPQPQPQHPPPPDLEHDHKHEPEHAQLVQVIDQSVDKPKPPEPEPETKPQTEPRKVPESLISFKEESNLVADLSDSERKALEELRLLVQEALDKHQFIYPPQPSQAADEPNKTSALPNPRKDTAETIETPILSSQEIATSEAPNAAAQPQSTVAPDKTSGPGVGAEEVSIWGVPLLKDDRSNVILLKFLRARDFKVKDAFIMLSNTIRWRKEFNIDGLIDEDLGDDLDKVVFMQGFDKEGHPVCYNVYGEFQNKDLYQKTFGDEDKRMRFLRWRIQFLERSIRKLDFSPGGISTIFQISDLKNSPGPAKRELRLATKLALQLLQDNYPEFVAKQVFINVPWWYLAFYTMISPFLTQRTKSKFVFAGPSKTAETLFKYISPEQVPIQYGGLSVDTCDCNPDFSFDDPATEITVKPGIRQTVEILVNEKCIIIWELRVVGWEVGYSAEYVPNAEGAYTVVIQKAKKMAQTDEPVVSNSFKISELGKIVLAIDNPTSKRKKLVYRFKVIPFCN